MKLLIKINLFFLAIDLIMIAIWLSSKIGVL